MTDEIDKYVRAFDESVDYTTHVADEAKQGALEDIDDLIRSKKRRNRKLWAYLDIDTDSTIDDYERDEDRDLDWLLGVAAMGAASLTQFVVSNVDDLIIKPVAYMEQILDPFDLDEKELITAGKRGAVGTAATVSIFQSIDPKYINRMNYISRLDPVEFYRAMRGFGGLPTIEKTTADLMGRAGWMTNYAKGSPQFKQAVSDMVDGAAGRLLKAQQRRAVERIHTEREVGGDRLQYLVWLCEGGKNTCGYCLDRGGEVMTYEDWIRDGLPGADVCAGGDLCNCRLAAV